NFDLEFQWSRIYGGPGAEVGKRVHVDALGDIYLVGYTSFGGIGAYDGYVIKIAPDGSLIWEVNVGSIEWDVLSSSVIWNDTLWVGGSSFNSISGLENQYFAQVDSDGLVTQELLIESNTSESIEDMFVFNNELLVSYTREHENTSDAGLAGYNTSMMELWSHEKNGDSEHTFKASHVNANELNNIGWVITSFATVNFEDEMIMSRFENDGTLLGEYGVESAGNQIARSTVWSGDAAMNIANSNIFGAGGTGVYMERRVNNGIWTAGVVFGGENDEDPRRIIEDSEGRLIVVGTSKSYADFTIDAYFYRLPSNFLVNDYELDLEENADEFLTSVFETIDDNVRVYPNPSSGKVNVSGLHNPFDYRLFSLAGKLLESGNDVQGELVFPYP
ncbi:MAG: SBBP repeat-containing protein, partial [Flavobacteriales bacterium]